MRTIRPTGATVAAAALAVTLSACSGGAADEVTPTTSPVSAEDGSAADAHNAADTLFAQMMIVHHEGAVEMAELAMDEGDADAVRALGERIAAAQRPEIDLMSGWLESWGEAQPADAGMGDMSHDGGGMEGAAQDEAIDELAGLSGPEFDRRFLELMIEHHQGAIEMAEAERADGENAEAVEQAGKIIDDQTAEITEMRNLLAGF